MSYEPMLKSGTVLEDSIQVIAFIGSGGQGEVYKVQYHHQTLALKWYFSQMVTIDLKRTLSNLIAKGSPDDNFLWPLGIVEDKEQFGYLMELRPNEYKSLLDWVTLKFDMDFSVMARACFKLTDAFHKLHAKGLSYKDVSFGNLFIEPLNGDILICDNDNVTANGMDINGLIGTPKFMAPEIVMGGLTPNTETDQFSLAILLFYILVISHPFDGRLEANILCFDEEAMKTLYGTDAVFIYDKNNDTNRPIHGIHNNAIKLWEIYPQYIKNLFHQTFTTGVKNPTKRSRESQWRDAFFRMYNSTLKCHCGMENFYDIAQYKTYGKLNPCILCKEDFLIPPRMRLNNQIIVLDDKKKLFVSHIEINDPSNLRVIAYIKKENSEFLVTNLSKNIWSYITLTDTIKLLPQQTVALKDRSIIDFGRVKGEIRL